jgi:hypothetical protein
VLIGVATLEPAEFTTIEIALQIARGRGRLSRRLTRVLPTRARR